MTIVNSEWTTVRIGDLGEIVTGGTPSSKTPEFFGDSYPFITPTDMNDALRHIETDRYLSGEGRQNQIRKQLPTGAVCFVCIGATIGKVCMTRTPSFTNQQINSVVTDSKRHDERFVYYLLSTLKDRVKGIAAGAATPIVNKSSFSDVEVSVPPKKNQGRIAAILSAYDDLIENNLRRIEILEEMAQSLYREWFVNFRFPGHEQVRMINSPDGKIPMGWEVTTLGRHLTHLESGKRPKGGVGDLANGIASVGAENIVGIGIHNYQNEKFVTPEFFQSLKKGVVQDKDVALYKDGAYIGRSTYFRDGFPHTDFCVNEHVFLLRSTGDQLTQNALYLWLKERSTIAVIQAKNANAAQPGINQEKVNGLELIVPTKEIASLFDGIVESYLALIVSLAKRNNVLRQTRDILLPKLISGELSVSKLDIDIRNLA